MASTLFSNDQELLRFEPEITDFIPSTQSDFVPQHIAAKDIIIEELIKLKILDTEFGHENAESQIHRPEELNLLSIYKTLAIIFGFLSPNGSDKFADKSNFYEMKFQEEFERTKRSLTVDLDGDGVEDKNEIQRTHGPQLRRV